MSDSESDFAASASDSDGYVEQQPSTPKPKKAAVKKKPAPKKAEKKSNAEPMSGISTPNEVDSTPSTPSMTTSGTATPKTKTIEEIYKRKSQLEHILLRPDTYIGSVEEEKKEMWIFENEKIVKKEISFVPGLYKIIDEILVNAADNKASINRCHYLIRDPQMSEIRIEVNREENRISVWNNGQGIPIEIHKEEKIYVPEMIFGHLLTSSNYDDEEEKLFGGRNGYGAKLCNIFSTEFIVRTADKERQLKYEQVFNDNMSKKKAPKITKNSKGEEYTEIIFKPDLSKFNLSELSEDFEKLIQKRAYDLAGCVKRGRKENFRVKFNKQKILINTFEAYSKLYAESTESTGDEDDKSKNNKIIFDTMSTNERWQVGFAVSDGQFTQASRLGAFSGNVSFVNSICTSKGGTHVNDVADKLASAIKAEIEKKRKGDKKVKPFHIRNYMSLYVNCLIPNPAFDSQTKETMITNKSQINRTNEYKPHEKFIEKVVKSGIVEKIIKWAEFKQSEQMAKADGSKLQRRINVPKLDDANLAGVKGQSKHCTLILTEGDSAKALVLGGLSVVGRDKYGVFPLRGKLLNVRDANMTAIQNNTEIQHIKTILGLKHNKKYTSVDELRYGSLMIMTDQDHDGSHIKGLIINFIDEMFPSLLDIPGFLLEFITPIIKCKKRGSPEVISFFTIPEYEHWALQNNKNKEWEPKYFKGLGTSDKKDAREYFSKLEMHKKNFGVPAPGDRQLIEMAFSKKKAAERKDWLAQYEPGTFMDHSVKEISIANFINQELMLFSMADNIRSIPSMVDGLKPGQRKVLYGTIKSRKKGEIKVAQLASSVSEATKYHHGEQSVQATIVGMAQDYVGSNNINLLVPAGQFGTRHEGGKDAASARYINTKLSKVTRTLFHVDDDPLLNYLLEENKSIEPQWYMPILPMVLVNGADGIGTGWSTTIPNYNPKDIVNNLMRMMDGEEIVSMQPWYRGYKGEITPAGDKKFNVSGIATINDDETITISELPIRVWTRSFKEQLEIMRDPKDKKPDILIDDFFDNCTDSTVEFTLYLPDNQLAKVERNGPVNAFKLQGTINTGNMVCFDSEGRIKRYDSAEAILREFYDLRLSYYQKRKAKLIEKLQDEYERYDNKAKFTELVIEKKLVYVNRNEEDVIKDFERHGLKRIYPKKDMKRDILAKEDHDEEETPSDEQQSATGDNGYNYLFDINVRGFTRQKLEVLRKQRLRKLEELQLCMDKAPKTFWREDLKNFMAEWDEMLEEDVRMLEMIQPRQQGTKKRRKPKVSRVKKKETTVTTAANGDVNMLQVETTATKTTKKTKQTTIDGLFKPANNDSSLMTMDDSPMLGGPDVFMDQLESMQDVGLDYNFDDPVLTEPSPLVEPSPVVEESTPASSTSVAGDFAESDKPSSTNTPIADSPVDDPPEDATGSPLIADSPALTSPQAKSPALSSPVIEQDGSKKNRKKRTRTESDGDQGAKKKRSNNDATKIDSPLPTEDNPSATASPAAVDGTSKPTSTVTSDDTDPFDYPFDTTPIPPPSKVKKAPVPKAAPKPATSTSKPSRVVKTKVKYVELSDEDSD